MPPSGLPAATLPGASHPEMRLHGRGQPLVAHVLPWPAVGGTETGTLRLIQGLSPAYEAVAFLPTGAKSVRELFEANGVRTEEYPPVEPAFRNPIPYLQATQGLASRFRRLGVRLVHCADLLAAYYAAPAAHLAGLKVVCHVRCRYPTLRHRDRLFLRTVSRFLFVSEDTRRSFDSGAARHRGTVIYDDTPLHPVSGEPELAALRAELEIAPGALVVGMVARLAPAKDFPTLVAAASQVLTRYPETIFVVVGDYSSAQAYREHFRKVLDLLEGAGVAASFRFPGYRGDAHRFMTLFDVNVLSTHTEGLPLVLLEAMALGRPVVATAVGGIPELIEDARTGLLVPPGSPGDLAAAIVRLLADPGLRVQLGSAAREAVSRNFAPARGVDSVKAEYASLLRRLRRGSPG